MKTSRKSVPFYVQTLRKSLLIFVVPKRRKWPIFHYFWPKKCTVSLWERPFAALYLFHSNTRGGGVHGIIFPRRSNLSHKLLSNQAPQSSRLQPLRACHAWSRPQAPASSRAGPREGMLLLSPTHALHGKRIGTFALAAGARLAHAEALEGGLLLPWIFSKSPPTHGVPKPPSNKKRKKLHEKNRKPRVSPKANARLSWEREWLYNFNSPSIIDV